MPKEDCLNCSHVHLPLLVLFWVLLAATLQKEPPDDICVFDKSLDYMWRLTLLHLHSLLLKIQFCAQLKVGIFFPAYKDRSYE